MLLSPERFEGGDVDEETKQHERAMRTDDDGAAVDDEKGEKGESDERKAGVLDDELTTVAQHKDQEIGRCDIVATCR